MKLSLYENHSPLNFHPPVVEQLNYRYINYGALIVSNVRPRELLDLEYDNVCYALEKIMLAGAAET